MFTLSTIDKEALGLVYAVTKFHQYLYGRKFVLMTDHKPLERIFGEDRQTPKIASNRLLRWAMTLNSYNAEIVYQPGKENCPADSLSRLPLETSENTSPHHGKLLHLRLQKLPISKHALKRETRNDKDFAKICQYLTTHWPNKENLQSNLTHYYEKRSELWLEEGILLWKGRICIPNILQSNILEMLHDGHPGATAMQSLARLHVYWPNLDNDILCKIKTCITCQQSRQNFRNAPMHPWGISSEPWSRLHLDFAGPFEGKMWMILVDSYTRWLEIIPMKNITSTTTINGLRAIFARFGLPRFLVTDNGPQLTSNTFEEFCEENGIVHIKVTPYHPKSNGLAERAVRTFKERMRSSNKSLDQFHRLQNFLFSYRNTVRRATNRTPSQLMFGRHLRSRFDLLKPDIVKNMELEQLTQKRNHDRTAVHQHFKDGEKVWINNPVGKGSVPGYVEKQTGPLSYHVNVDGITRRKHCDQMRKRTVECDLNDNRGNTRGTEHDELLETSTYIQPNVREDRLLEGRSTQEETIEAIIPQQVCAEPGTSEDPGAQRESISTRRYPERIRKKPDRYIS